MNNNEQIINVPLKIKIKALLERRADENGRATNREAAEIIKNALKNEDKNDGAKS